MGIYDELSRLDEDRSPKAAPSPVARTPEKSTRKGARKTTPVRDNTREEAREESRGMPREMARGPGRDGLTRDEVQEFSFRLRDAINVKVQAEVPHQWREELEQRARKLNVKKLELYRYILGEFLGKVQRKAKP